jgi:N6-L-threonylcarbamoyladenine synthase
VPNRLILGIESSCDETSAAVVRGGNGARAREFQVLSNVVASQLIHSDYGGVVPELASREHLRAIVPVVREAMQRAGLTCKDLDAIAVTEGPGLAGALLVGITFAKALAFGADLPLIAVNHLEGHIHAVLMDTHNPGAPPLSEVERVDSEMGVSESHNPQTWESLTPLLALVVSGGHTHLYLATLQPNHTWLYRNVGKTLDDAAGEAFDKVAKLLGLPYPGGPWIDALAAHGNPRAVPFTFAQIKAKATGNTAPKLSRENLTHDDQTRFDLSFSGIKTAVRRYVELHNLKPGIDARSAALREAGLDKSKPSDPANVHATLAHFDAQTLDLIASFQASVTGYLTRQTLAAAGHFGAQGILVSGGVAANSELRSRITAAAAERGLPIAFPTIALSTDNAAMIAAAAFPKLITQTFATDTLEPTPQLRLG